MRTIPRDEWLGIHMEMRLARINRKALAARRRKASPLPQQIPQCTIRRWKRAEAAALTARLALEPPNPSVICC